MKLTSPLACVGTLAVLCGIVLVTWSNSRDGGLPQADSRTVAAAPRIPLPIPPPTTARAPAALASLDAETLERERAAEKDAIARVLAGGRSQMQAVYNAERVDAAWAQGKEARLTQLSTSEQIERLSAQPLAIDVSCRTSMCRLTAGFTAPSTADDWLALYTMAAGVEMPKVSTHRTIADDGSVRLELYGFTRP